MTFGIITHGITIRNETLSITALNKEFNKVSFAVSIAYVLSVVVLSVAMLSVVVLSVVMLSVVVLSVVVLSVVAK
jgi:hypothetical protein